MFFKITWSTWSLPFLQLLYFHSEYQAMVLFVILTQNYRSITSLFLLPHTLVTTLSLLYIYFYFLLVASAFYSLKMREISAFWTCKLWWRIIVPLCCWQVQTLDKCLTKSVFAASCRSCVSTLTVFSTHTPHLEQPARPLKEKQRRSLAPFLSIVGAK